MERLEKRFRVSQWIAEEFAGVSHEEHQALLEDWRQESVENEEEYQELLCEFMLGKNQPTLADKRKVQQQWDKFSIAYASERKLFRQWIAYAACLIVLLGIGGVWIFNQGKQEELSEKVLPATGDILLILSNGKEVVLNGDSLQKIEESKTEIQVTGKVISYSGKKDVKESEVFNTLMIPGGGEFQLVLADGTRVWLNAQTEFRYPVNFTGDSRQVYLNGEAYFEVVKDERRPFIVRTEAVDIRVLGTCFNVNDTRVDGTLEVTLVEGKVEVGDRGTAQRFVLYPDEQARVRQGQITVRDVDAGLYTSWVKGKFCFEGETLEEIAAQLERWYGVSFFFTRRELQERKFTGSVFRDESIEQILRLLEKTADVQCQVNGSVITVN